MARKMGASADADQRNRRLGPHQMDLFGSASANVTGAPAWREPQGVLPVDPGPDSVSGLSIAEVLEELEERDQSQPPRRKGGLPPVRVEPLEVLILVHCGHSGSLSQHESLMVAA